MNKSHAKKDNYHIWPLECEFALEITITWKSKKDFQIRMYRLFRKIKVQEMKKYK